MSERAITEGSWERTKGSMDSSSLFKFTKGKVEAEHIIRMAQQKLLMAYLHITSMGSPDLRVKGKVDYNKFGHYAKECTNGKDTSIDEDNNHSRDIFNDRRNDR